MSRASKYLSVACPACLAKAGEKCSHFVTCKDTVPHASRKLAFDMRARKDRQEAKLEKTKP